MKTIEKQAREYACDGIKPDSAECESCYHVYGKCNHEAFLAGAKAATRWIPVEEEDPNNKTELILALDRDGHHKITSWIDMFFTNKTIQYERKDPSYNHYTYWLPIPPKPEK